MSNIENPVVTLVVTIVASFATAILTSVLASWQYWRGQKAELEKEFSIKFNNKKWEVYTQFAELVRDMFGDDPIDSVELTGREVALASQIVLIGSDDVVVIFHDWREASSVYGKSHPSTKAKLFKLIATMRKDLGNKFTQLSIDVLLGSLEPGQAKEI